MLIHGFADNTHFWLQNGVADALKENHQVIMLDCRGHGLRGKPYDPRRYGPQMAEEMILPIDPLSIGKTHLRGYGMGADLVAQNLARHPQRVITAKCGGFGVPETNPRWQEQVPPDRTRPPWKPRPKRPRPPAPPTITRPSMRSAMIPG